MDIGKTPPPPATRLKTKAPKKELTVRQVANAKARSVGGKLLNADGYILYLKDTAKYYSSLNEFLEEE